MGAFSSVTRNTVNQCVALVVFLALLNYAWSKDMLFKPDPAIPLKGGKPRRDRAVDMYIFPTHPAFYASADSTDELQQLYEADKEAMSFTRRLAQVYMKYYLPPKPDFPIAMDVGSPWGTWGIYMSALGMKTSILQPRTPHYRRTEAAISFGKLARVAKVLRKGLANRRIAVGFDNKNHRWIPVSNKVHKEDDVDIATTVLYQDEMGRGVGFALHVGSDAKMMPALRAATEAAEMPKMVMVDVAGRLNGVVDYTLENSVTLTEELLSIGTIFRKAGYSMYLFPHKACPIETADYTSHTLLDSELHSISVTQQDALLTRLYSLATTPSTEPLCRLVWLKQQDFEKTSPPFIFLTLVSLKLLCVVFMCYKKKKKAVSRSL